MKKMVEKMIHEKMKTKIKGQEQIRKDCKNREQKIQRVKGKKEE